MAKKKVTTPRKPSPAPFAPPQWPATRVELWKLDKIKPYPSNPRTHPQAQVDQLARDMISDGVTMPILVDEAGVIIAGHGRRLGALAAGFEEYPVAIARGWTEEQKQAARIKDNAVGLLSGWDAELIRGEIANLKLAGYDIPLLGFPEAQLRGWGIAVGTESGADPDAAPDPPKKPVVRRGDLWMLGDHRLLCGDSTSKTDVATCIGDAKPNLMVTDPPYGVDYDPAWRARSGVNLNAKKLGKVINDHRANWSDAWKAFAGDVLYVWHADRFASTVQDSLEEAGFEVCAQIVWAKDRLALSRGDYHWQHEPCWYAVRKGNHHAWNGGRSQTTLWSIPARDDSGHGHGTQKPVECMKRPIENNSRKGNHVYEPFCGSGTTIIAAEMTGRRALAIEIDPAYVQVAIERWETFTGRKATLAGKTLDEVGQARRRGRARGDHADTERRLSAGVP